MTEFKRREFEVVKCEEEGYYDIKFDDGEVKHVREFIELEGYDEKYKVWIDGRVTKNCNKELNKSTNSRKNITIILYQNKMIKTKILAKLIYETFIDIIHHKYKTININGDILNCSLHNICLLTQNEIKILNNKDDFNKYGLPITNYPNYRINTEGQIYSISSGRFLDPYTPLDDSYSSVQLSNDSGHKLYPVHHLVAETYIGPRPEGLVIDHIDKNKTNNKVENLRYATYSVNNSNRSKNAKVHTKKYVNNFTGYVNIRFEHGLKCENCGYMINLTGTVINKQGLILGLSKTGGYIAVRILDDNDKSHKFYIHRLLMLTFRYNEYFKDAVVNHINRNKEDNRLENLEFITCKGNVRHGCGTKICKIDRFSKKIVKIYVSYTEMSNDLGLSNLNYDHIKPTIENFRLYHEFYWKLYEENDKLGDKVNKIPNEKTNGQKVCQIDSLNNEIIRIFNSYSEIARYLKISRVKKMTLNNSFTKGDIYSDYRWKEYENGDTVGDIYIFEENRYKKKDDILIGLALLGI
jgi:hypothetical protein